MVYLDKDAFMSQLSKLYSANKEKGSVWITMKRVERPIVTGRKKLEDDGPVCLVRATDGKTKLACAVPASQHVAFHLDLFPVIRANTEKLQKPKRVHANKTKSGGES